LLRRAEAASAAVLERLTVRREGHLRQSTWAKGEWTDDLLYALLQEEVANRPGMNEHASDTAADPDHRLLRAQ
jgi:hypothetical protein